MRRVRSDCLLLLSRNDRTVPLRAGDIIGRRIGSRTIRRIVLEESNHTLVNHVEREKVADALIEWFARENKAPSEPDELS